MLISIIVPVYNCAEYLPACLDSLLGQTHRDLEVVCVDDGSTDASPALLADYAARDGRVRVITQENAGVSAARNVGIAAARGEVLMFVDADDLLEPFACARVAEVFERERPEVLTFGLRGEPAELVPASLRHELCPRDAVYDGFAPALLFEEYARPYACRTALARDFALRERIGFEPGLALAEDQVFYFVVYPLSRKTVLMADALYVYHMREESATHEGIATRELLEKKLDSHFAAIEAILREWHDRKLGAGCDEELLEWVVDFTLLDIRRLPPEAQVERYRRLFGALEGYFGCNLLEVAHRGPTRACIKAVCRALGGAGGTGEGAGSTDARVHAGESAEGPAAAGSAGGANVVGSAAVVRFFVMRRGVARCLERVAMRLGIVR